MVAVIMQARNHARLDVRGQQKVSGRPSRSDSADLPCTILDVWDCMEVALRNKENIKLPQT